MDEPAPFFFGEKPTTSRHPRRGPGCCYNGCDSACESSSFCLTDQDTCETNCKGQ